MEDRLWDAVVVGAGPAGSMTALELARAGASVLLLDRQAFPRWKVCGSCLSPGTQSLLRGAGLGPVLSALGPAPLRTLRLGGWATRAEVPLGPSVALSRAALDAALAAAAVEAGATFRAPARARLATSDPRSRVLRVDVEGASLDVRARLVVAADGVGSPLLAQALGSSSANPPSSGSHVGLGGVFASGIADFEEGVIHMAVGPTGYVGLVRLEDGSLDVGAAVDPNALAAAGGPDALLNRLLTEADFPELPGLPDSGWRGTPRLTRSVASRGAHRLLAVGDAAGYVEPFTGEGMGWALAGARALAPVALRGIRDWSPDLVHAWDDTHGRTLASAARLCRGVAWALRSPALVRAGLHLLHHAPFVARPFVRVVGRAPTPLSPSLRTA